MGPGMGVRITLKWSKKPIHWESAYTHYYSIVFSWDLWDFLQTAQIELDGKDIAIGGPAVKINKAWVPEWIKTPDYDWPQLYRHNPLATRTTMGCPRHCGFCSVPIIESEYRELDDWEIKPIVCDNNLLAASNAHFARVIYRLKALEWCDFNQGLDSRLMTQERADMLAGLRNPIIRLAFDGVGYEHHFLSAFYELRNAGIPKKNIRAYVLIGYKDNPEDALYRLRLVKGLGITPNPMRYQPINAKRRNECVAAEWTHKELDRYMSYWQNLRYVGGVPFEEYKHNAHQT